MYPVTLHRRTKKEIQQAVEDLQKRGYELISPITNTGEWRKDFEYTADGKRRFAGVKMVNQWTAKMAKAVKK